MTQPPGRNDPCPCGSGKKFKRCHGAGSTTGSALRLVGESAPPVLGNVKLPPGVSLSRSWEAEVAPIPATIEDDPDARLAIVLIAAPPLVVHADTVANPPADHAGIARLLAAALSAAVASSGVTPLEVAVRTPALADALEPLVAERGISVRASRELPALSDALRSLTTHLTGVTELYPHVRSNPETWRGWNVGTDRVGRLFSAAASYFRAAPWRTLADDQWIAATIGGTREWTAVVLGNAGQEFGLALYAEREDVEDLVRAEIPAAAMQNPRGPVIALTFDRKDILPARMQREILAARWEVAGAMAYPALVVLGTPGGGITAEQVDDLTVLLRAVAGFEREHRAALRAPSGPLGDLTWTDAASSALLRYDGGSILDHIELEPLWPVPAVLAVSGPRGKGAKPGATLARASDKARAKLIDATIDRFAGFLAAGRGAARSVATIGRDLGQARLFLDFLVFGEGVPLAAITEFDLREYLYDWYPRKVRDTLTNARTVPVSLRRFFDFLAKQQQIECPWAAPILRDRESFIERVDLFPGGFIWDEAVQDWIAEFTEDLQLRVLLPTTSATAGITWGATMGPVEWELNRELHRHWLAWRDEIVESGTTAAVSLFDALIERADRWAATPQAGPRGLTPGQAIAREQQVRTR